MPHGALRVGEAEAGRASCARLSRSGGPALSDLAREGVLQREAERLEEERLVALEPGSEQIRLAAATLSGRRRASKRSSPSIPTAKGSERTSCWRSTEPADRRCARDVSARAPSSSMARHRAEPSAPGVPRAFDAHSGSDARAPRATPVTVALKAPFPAALGFGSPLLAGREFEPTGSARRGGVPSTAAAACASSRGGPGVERRAFAARSRASPTRTVRSSPTGLLPAPPTSISTSCSSPTKWSRNRRLSSSTTSANARPARSRLCADSDEVRHGCRFSSSAPSRPALGRCPPARSRPVGGGRRAPTARPAGRAAVQEIVSLYEGRPGVPAWSTRSSPRAAACRALCTSSQPAERRPTRDVNSIGSVPPTGGALSATRAEVASGVAGSLQRARERNRLISAASATASEKSPRRPFKGSHPFETDDADYFFDGEEIVADPGEARLRHFLRISGPGRQAAQKRTCSGRWRPAPSRGASGGGRR